MSLKKDAVGGVFWTFLQQFGSQIINFGISIILARLLLPKDFGTIALMDIIMAVGTIVIGGGMASSLIRTTEADERDYSTVFYFNFATSIIMYLIAYAIAPFLADFYEVPLLTSLTRVYCISFFIGAFTSIQRTILIKEMKFKKQMIIELPSLILSGLVGIIMAYSGYGVWSLIGSSLTLQLAQSIQYWILSDWSPKLIFDSDKFKIHFKFGSNILISGLVNVVFGNLYTLIIGKLFSMTDLGNYNRAHSMKQLPVSNISVALNKVTFPLFAKIKNDNATLKVVYSKLMKMVIFIIAPIMFYIMVFAKSIVLVLLTEKWIEVVPYLQILCLAAILTPIQQYNLNILQIKNRSDLFLRIDLVKKAVVVIMILITIKIGIIALLWGQVVVSIIALFINSYYSGKYIDLSLLKQVKMLYPSILLSAIIAGFTFAFKEFFLHDLHSLIIIFVGGILFFTSYLLFNIFIKNESLHEIKLLISERKSLLK